MKGLRRVHSLALVTVVVAIQMPRADDLTSVVLCNVGSTTFSAAAEVHEAEERSARPWHPVEPETCHVMASSPDALEVSVGIWAAGHGFHVGDVMMGTGCLPPPPLGAQAISAGGNGLDRVRLVHQAPHTVTCPTATRPTPLVSRRHLAPGAVYVIGYSIDGQG
ncbi:MAG: hypothetical protein AAFR84_04010 [Pseudomonadota bacterium]